MNLGRGARLGPYEIQDQLGEGGMGVVYRARDPRLNRDVAIKVVRADVVGDPDRRARFIQEARAVSGLNHPNIVTVHDIGTEGETVFLVMELVDGKPLDDLIRHGGLRISDVLRIGAQIADACARAHAQHIIHRDLKPANVMIQPDGRVKVLDFGLAKLIASADRGPDPADATRTAEGVIVGTVAYMSPEQAEGKAVDERSDIFSLGALLYELSVGKRPFEGDSTASILASVLRSDPASPSALRADMPSELARVVMRCLRKDPSRRVQSAADLKVALEELRDDVDSGRLSGPAIAPARAASRRGGLIAIGAAILVAGGAIAAALFWRSAPAPASAEQTVVPFTSYPGDERAGAFSPDGNQLVFDWTGPQGDNRDIYVKLVNVEPPLRLTTDPRIDGRPRWARNGREIAFIRAITDEEFAVLTISPLGGPERRVGQFFSKTDNGYLLGNVEWTPDSKALLVSGARTAGAASDVLRLALDTGEVRTVLTADPNELGYSAMSFSPDGRSLAVSHLAAEGRVIDVIALTDTFEPRATTKLRNIGAPVLAFAWTGTSGELIYSVAVNNPESLYRVAVSGDSPPVPMPWTGAGAIGPVTSRDGARLVFTRVARDANIWRIPIDRSRPPERIAASSFREAAPQYSPDGKRLAFFSNRGGSVQIWTSDADGNHLAQVTSLDPHATTGTPRWSPDGQQLSFDSNVGGQYEIYVVGADGGQPRAITSGSANFVSAWSPDGQWIYFSSTRTGRDEVWRTHADGTGPEQVTRNGGSSPLFSSDGQWLYFTKRNGAEGIWRMPVAGGEETRVVDALFRYNFAVTATGVYFVPPIGKDGRSSVQFKDFKTGAITDIVKPERPIDLGLAVSPDGRWLLFNTLDYEGSDLMLADRVK